MKNSREKEPQENTSTQLLHQVFIHYQNHDIVAVTHARPTLWIPSENGKLKLQPKLPWGLVFLALLWFFSSSLALIFSPSRSTLFRKTAHIKFGCNVVKVMFTTEWGSLLVWVGSCEAVSISIYYYLKRPQLIVVSWVSATVGFIRMLYFFLLR